MAVLVGGSKAFPGDNNVLVGTDGPDVIFGDEHTAGATAFFPDVPAMGGRGNARDQPAISVAMKASSQPAYLRLPFRLALSVVSARARLSAILRSRARLRAAFRSRTRLASSRKVTSRTQCSPFSTRQWLRMAAASASGGSLALER